MNRASVNLKRLGLLFEMKIDVLVVEIWLKEQL